MEQDPVTRDELALFGDIGDLLQLVTLEDIARAWCSYTGRPHVEGVNEEDLDEWAIYVTTRIEDLDETQARTLIDLLVFHAPSDEVLGVLGAGPLENFTMGCDEDRLRWIESRAAASSRFRQALGNVWIWELPPDAFNRVERAAGTPLARPDHPVVIDFVPGELPGTVHVTRDGVVIQEIEAAPMEVGAMIEMFKRLNRGEPD